MKKKDQYYNFCEKASCCRECSLGCELVDYYDPHVLGQGNLDAKLFFIAEAPGKNETIDRRPLTSSDKSGAIYNKLLTSLGLTRDEVFTTNCLVCRPPGDRPPLPYEFLTCLPFLMTQLELVKPRLVVSFGRIAASTFLSNFKLTRDHGKIIKSKSFDVDVFSLYHPNYIGCYAQDSKRQEFKVDITNLKTILKGYI